MLLVVVVCLKLQLFNDLNNKLYLDFDCPFLILLLIGSVLKYIYRKVLLSENLTLHTLAQSVMPYASPAHLLK